MDTEEFARRAAESHGRDRSVWLSLVRAAQDMPKQEKAKLLEEISKHDLRAASRFARDAGVSGQPATRLLELAATTLDASEISWVVENLVHAMGEERFARAAVGLRNAENRAFEKVRYWALKYLSDTAKELLGLGSDEGGAS